MAIKLTEQSPKRKPKKPEGQTRSGQQRAARQKIRRALGRPAIHRNIDGLLDQIKMRRRLLSHGMGQMRSIIDIRQVPVPQSNQFTFHSKAVGEKGVVHKQVINLYDVGLKNGALGGRLLGAGGGGYILFFFSPKKRNQLKAALEKEGGQIMNFKFDFEGTKIWSVKDKF